MSLIKWNDSLSVKIKSIDDQHKKLVEMINEFYENIRSNSNNESISALINKMKEYTIYHFEFEEKLLETNNYSDIELHKKEHEDFIKKVVDLETRFNEGKLIISFEITSFLKDWLKKHIKGTDMQYSALLVENGAK